MAQSTSKSTKIVVIGGNGTIGKYIVKALKEGHNSKESTLEIVIGGRGKDANIDVDISDTKSVSNFFSRVKKIDHLIVCCGTSVFGPLKTITKEDYTKGFGNKVFGQIDIVLQGIKGDSINDHGSITLTTGMVDLVPFPMCHGLGASSGCINAFVKSAATEMPRSIRLNVVSPGLLRDSVPMFGAVMKGVKPVEGPDVALAYVRSIYGGLNGKIFDIGGAPAVTEK